MNAAVRRLILAYIDKRLNNCENLRAYGKDLVGGMTGKWRYRVGSYRILAEIRDNDMIIYIFTIGHRKEIYS